MYSAAIDWSLNLIADYRFKIGKIFMQSETDKGNCCSHILFLNSIAVIGLHLQQSTHVLFFEACGPFSGSFIEYFAHDMSKLCRTEFINIAPHTVMLDYFTRRSTSLAKGSVLFFSVLQRPS